MTHEESLALALERAATKAGYPIPKEEIRIDRSKDPAHGDYASNFALKFAKKYAQKPLDLANAILKELDDASIDHVEIAGPGFINFFLKKESLGAIVPHILELGDHFGDGEKKGIKINVEYVSANPTGDLHLGHTRGAALGDSIANLYKKAGYEVTREYYVNDCGNQVAHLGHSLRCRYHELFGEPLELGEDDYHGQDLIAIAKEVKEAYGDKHLVDNEESKAFFVRFGIDHELSKIKKDLADFGVVFDRYSYESDIRKGDTLQKTIEELQEKGYVYTLDGATFLKTSAFLDDKDRPIIKKDGLYTYFMPDICYHYDKMARGYDVLVDLLGADHHGYVARMKSALMMKGYSPNALQAEIYQIVRVFQNGEEVKMSKRTGKSITHRELVAEVGKDAVRYFFSARSSDTHLDFNMDLAVSHSKDNPVYYAQYAHARCSSLLHLGEDIPLVLTKDAYKEGKEDDILKQLADFPSMIEAAAKARAPYKVANYIERLAQGIHEYYASTKIIDREHPEESGNRLLLIKACQIVLRNALALLGVSAPERM